MPRRAARNLTDPDIAPVAALFADPSRAAMLFALLDGRTLAASELAKRAGVSPAAASGHLAKLVMAGLLAVQPVGRRRLYRIVTADVGRAIEVLATLAKPPTIVALEQNILVQHLRAARSCYDHLAGRLGVGITDALVARNAIVPAGSRDYRLGPDGSASFAALGIHVEPLRHKKRYFARQCIDWTERCPHLGGALGAALRDRLLENGWIEHTKASRALRITAEGHRAIGHHFDVRLEPTA